MKIHFHDQKLAIFFKPLLVKAPIIKRFKTSLIHDRTAGVLDYDTTSNKKGIKILIPKRRLTVINIDYPIDNEDIGVNSTKRRHILEVLVF
ncbi:MAG: hypothetical protein OXC61_00465 [Flavobacteriaceae bacterium]|nr:hypothetical protein [Flavobacteriaceae bacterium]